MSFNARLRLAFARETMFPPRGLLLFEGVGNLPVPHAPPHEAHGPEAGP
jgi:hypothetical protein